MNFYPSQLTMFVVIPDTTIHDIIDLPASPTLGDRPGWLPSQDELPLQRMEFVSECSRKTSRGDSSWAWGKSQEILRGEADLALWWAWKHLL